MPSKLGAAPPTQFAAARTDSSAVPPFHVKVAPSAFSSIASTAR